MSTCRFPLCAAALALALAFGPAGCVDRGGWQPAAQLVPAQLPAQRTLALAPTDPSAWPADGWWRGYQDGQLDALVGEALAGSPSLTIAEARLRAAQGEALGAAGLRLPQAALD